MKSVNSVIRGGIYFLDLFHEERYKCADGYWTGTCLELKCRPYIVVTNDIINAVSPTVQVIPCTTVNKNIRSHIPFRFDNKDAYAMVEQLQTIDKGRISYKYFRGVVSPDILDEVKVKLLQHLGFAEYDTPVDNIQFNQVVRNSDRIERPKQVLLEDIPTDNDIVRAKSSPWTDDIKFSFLSEISSIKESISDKSISKAQADRKWKSLCDRYGLSTKKSALTYACSFRKELNVVDSI